MASQDRQISPEEGEILDFEGEISPLDEELYELPEPQIVSDLLLGVLCLLLIDHPEWGKIRRPFF